MTLTVQRATDRFLTDIDWLDSKHSFNFGAHYREGDGGHGLLLVNNDDTVAPGGGFGTHGHRDMEIVTWVLSGKLEHHDSEGNHGVLYPGLAQRMSAGSGIRHSEKNASDTEPDSGTDTIAAGPGRRAGAHAEPPTRRRHPSWRRDEPSVCARSGP